MSSKTCPQCGAPNDLDAKVCKYCGEAFEPEPQPVAPVVQRPVQPQYQQPMQPQYQQPMQPQYQQPMQPQYQQPMQPQIEAGVDPSWPIKSKIAAGLLAIFLGGLGIHKFYMGKIGLGILYLVFCWTYVPLVIGIIEGIIYLASNDHNFQVKNKVRIR